VRTSGVIDLIVAIFGNANQVDYDDLAQEIGVESRRTPGNPAKPQRASGDRRHQQTCGLFRGRSWVRPSVLHPMLFESGIMSRPILA
jgi:hypothetical protein